MSLHIGNNKIGSLYLGSTKIKEAWVGNVKVYGSGDPYNPLGLPPFTIRCKFKSGYTPTKGTVKTLVDASENVWDITNNHTNWSSLFQSVFELLEVRGANTTGVTSVRQMFDGCGSLNSVSLFDTSSCDDMARIFYACTSLTSVPLFDTSSCTNMWSMFGHCYSLTSVPLFDTRSCTSMLEMFYYCISVQSGALALYQQASAKPVPYHSECFQYCGSNTDTGRAELQQIPSSWGGLAPG